MSRKSELRKKFLQWRARLLVDEIQGFSSRIVDHINANRLTLRSFTSVGLYTPFRNEPNILGVASKFASHTSLFLPVITGKFMTYCQWHPKEELVKNSWGIDEPQSLQSAMTADEKWIIFVPCLALNHQGYRLGYGGGYYDRFLSDHPLVQTIGVTYSAAVVDEEFQEPHDIRLQAFVTELGMQTIAR